MILILDNYDSFTFNLYQYIGSLGREVKVIRNDALSVEQVRELHPTHIVLSPGPGYPAQAGICTELVRQTHHTPILGVCLGHQAICEAFGGRIVRAPRIMHGKADTAQIDTRSPVFAGLPDQIPVGRYHSLVCDPSTLPGELAVTATTDDGCIMAVQHREHPIYGIQFHPESVLTPNGMNIIQNFLNQ
ncbi:glutamine amidotransferase, class I [[Clostridium] methylpentosum DSM 5476]|uniref:Glutamine amidotransferase, class I n=1 Tax=[Clostridium] methylpentosum DSM 5476 TaxID=537013 RepID=C0EA56_9FIRM|nr:glutamine amidotransferase, class I [[Clostridium] methylpentosum DSM 5476]MEE1492167.1 aminodeoxychorismate/anthranilate synthase component II [Massilioclostridium sp.]